MLKSRSLAIDYLEVRGNAKILYMYFDYKTQQDQTAINVAKCLLKQLLCQSRLSPELENLYENSIRNHQPPSIEAIKEHVKNYSKNNTIYIVVDALDECNEDHQNTLLSLFTELQGFSSRLLISFRPHLRHIQTQLFDSRIFKILANDGDLRNYTLSRLEKVKNKNPILQHRCLNLIEAVQGM